MNAEVLWNQPANTNFPVFSTINQQFNDNPDVSTFVVNDITVGASGWTINSLTEWFSTFGRGSNPATLPVVFNLFSKTGALPRGTDDPTAGLGLTATITADGPYFQFTISNLNLVLAPGDYWIGFTPIADNSVFGQNFYQQSNILLGDQSAFRNPGGGLFQGPDWKPVGDPFNPPSPQDGSLLIQGIPSAAPEPGTLALFVAGGTLVLSLHSRFRRSVR